MSECQEQEVHSANNIPLPDCLADSLDLVTHEEEILCVSCGQESFKGRLTCTDLFQTAACNQHGGAMAATVVTATSAAAAAGATTGQCLPVGRLIKNTIKTIRDQSDRFLESCNVLLYEASDSYVGRGDPLLIFKCMVAATAREKRELFMPQREQVVSQRELATVQHAFAAPALEDQNFSDHLRYIYTEEPLTLKIQVKNCTSKALQVKNLRAVLIDLNTQLPLSPKYCESESLQCQIAPEQVHSIALRIIAIKACRFVVRALRWELASLPLVYDLEVPSQSFFNRFEALPSTGLISCVHLHGAPSCLYAMQAQRVELELCNTGTEAIDEIILVFHDPQYFGAQLLKLGERVIAAKQSFLQPLALLAAAKEDFATRIVVQYRTIVEKKMYVQRHCCIQLHFRVKAALEFVRCVQLNAPRAVPGERAFEYEIEVEKKRGIPGDEFANCRVEQVVLLDAHNWRFLRSSAHYAHETKKHTLSLVFEPVPQQQQQQQQQLQQHQEASQPSAQLPSVILDAMSNCASPKQGNNLSEKYSMQKIDSKADFKTDQNSIVQIPLQSSNQFVQEQIQVICKQKSQPSPVPTSTHHQQFITSIMLSQVQGTYYNFGGAFYPGYNTNMKEVRKLLSQCFLDLHSGQASNVLQGSLQSDLGLAQEQLLLLLNAAASAAASSSSSAAAAAAAAASNKDAPTLAFLWSLQTHKKPYVGDQSDYQAAGEQQQLAADHQTHQDQQQQKAIYGVVLSEAPSVAPNTSDGSESRFEQLQLNQQGKLITVETNFRRDHYEYHNKLGQGAFGRVFRVRKKNCASSKSYAMKIIDKSKIAKFNLQNHIMVEQSVMANARSPFIVKLKKSFQDSQRVYLVMEFIDGDSLDKLLMRTHHFNEEETRFIMAEVILGLEYLHKELHIVYRDLKPSNIMVNKQGHIVLIDFGITIHFKSDDQLFKTLVGTREYMAPEIAQGMHSPPTLQQQNSVPVLSLKQQNSQGEAQDQSIIGHAPPSTNNNNNNNHNNNNQKQERQHAYRCQHTKNVDFWNLGILLYQLLVGFLPFGYFDKEKPDELFINIQQNKPNLPYFLSEQAKDLITKFLQTDANQRLGAQSFHDIWSHPFFQGVDWTNLKIKKVESPIAKHMQQAQPAQRARSISNIETEPLQGQGAQAQGAVGGELIDLSLLVREDAQHENFDIQGITMCSAPEIDEFSNKREGLEAGAL